MNPYIKHLHSYPFEKWAQLIADVPENHEYDAITLSIGEPQHPAPRLVLDKLAENLDLLASYPLTKGSDALRETIAQWLKQRFLLGNTPIDPQTQIIPVNGTREALFAFAQTIIDPGTKPVVLAPNPFYQIYEGAAILAGADIQYLNTTQAHQFAPDLDKISADTWQRCQLMYICSPGNPTGKVLPRDFLGKLLDLAERFDFIIAADECYSEIYADESRPPPGLLQVAASTGREAFERCIVFHSLSKRSNLPGLRSGFVAGDAKILQQFLRYRTYHGCAMAPPTQIASIAAWSDETHVQHNRDLYRHKFEAVLAILKPTLEINPPDAGFYLWLATPIDDQAFAKALYAQKNITVLPGSYLSRLNNGINPGQNYVRIALVAEIKQCIAAANQIKDFVNSL
ncbi:MAG TPA: succinyldiaminopimelate transaminase [Gammaproteobacteria bacterium]|nr:succinyldiaminopimelate transaminase [Gammaproteobacteria bacterium]